jgi:hypothetical protein
MNDKQGAAAPDTQAPSDAPSGDAGGDDGEQVVLTRSQVNELYKSAHNRAYAEARQKFTKREPQQQAAHQQQHEDPRVKRGLELLAKYEAGEAFKTDTLAALSGSPQLKRDRAPTPAQQPAAAQPQSELGQLVELMRLDIASRMADKLPKAPVRYESPGDQVRSELNAAIGDIAPDDPQRHEKVQRTVLERLKNTKIRPSAGGLPSWATNPNQKGK